MKSKYIPRKMTTSQALMKLIHRVPQGVLCSVELGMASYTNNEYKLFVHPASRDIIYINSSISFDDAFKKLEIELKACNLYQS